MAQLHQLRRELPFFTASGNIARKQNPIETQRTAAPRLSGCILNAFLPPWRLPRKSEGILSGGTSHFGAAFTGENGQPTMLQRGRLAVGTYDRVPNAFRCRDGQLELLSYDQIMNYDEIGFGSKQALDRNLHEKRQAGVSGLPGQQLKNLFWNASNPYLRIF